MNRSTVLAVVLRASLLMLVGVLLLGATPLFAQVEEGTLVGTVMDTSGGAISGATVTLVNQGTDATLTFTTGGDGLYKFTPLKIGVYKVTASAPGFETVTETDIRIDVSSNVLINVTLKPGQTTQTIEVTAEQPVLETQSGSVGQVIDQHNVDNLPLNGRNFTFLAQLAAGVNTPQADTRGNAATGAFSANGNRPAQNNYLLDGIDNNSDTVDFLNGTNFVVLPPVDAISEFKVQTSDFSAEFGRSGAAVLNATIKSGTNELHGTLWEFLRNDKLDAADYFSNADGVPKGEYRQNQFGVAGGFPVIIPHLFDGRNKVFIFGDYEGLRRVQGTTFTGSVPTTAEQASLQTNTANFQDLITGQTGSRADALGRTIANGVVLDPATTRPVTAGAVDPVTGLTAATTGFVRDPFSNGTCTSATSFTVTNYATCGLNLIPIGRLDQNAINLLKLYPAPTKAGVLSNYGDSPKGTEFRNAFDTRLDINFSQKDTLFGRFSYVDDPQLIPGIFGGVADGGGFQDGDQTADAQQTALGYTHTFSPTLVNEVRVGFNYLHTTRSGPESNNLAGTGGAGIPADFGIQDVPQTSLNGGLPAFGINGLATLGSNAFLPSNEVSSTLQITDDVTKIWGKHTFKMGIEFQHVKFSTLQPPWSRGEFDYNGDYTDVVGANAGNTGRVDFLLTPELSTVPGGIDYVGGSSQVYLSNTSETDNGKNYYGGYLNDDWKVTPKLTVNLGLRYDFFGLVFDHHGEQANFIPTGGPLNQPTYLLPASTPCSSLSTSVQDLFAADGIACDSTNAYGKGLGHSQKTNFSPRIGFAYQVTPKLVVRGGFGIFYNGFENRGYSPNLGENYPFQFNFSYGEPNAETPITAISAGGCAAGSTPQPGGVATFETGFSCTSLDPALVNANGLALRGIQFNYQTPYSMSGNLTVQYQIAPSLSFQVAYATSQSRHLEVFPSSNNVTSFLPFGTATNSAAPNNETPFASFGTGSSYAATEGDSGYNALQTRVEKQYKYGLNFLATYTYSKTLTDAFDLLNGGSIGNYRGPNIPGVGIHYDFGLAPFDIRNVFHFSGGYELPFGKGKHFMSDASGVKDKLVGGWSIQYIVTLQDGQPITLDCPTTPSPGTNCYDLRVKGQPLDLGIHTDSNGVVSWFGNPKAFTQPCELGAGLVPIPNTPTGCVPLTGIGALGGGGTQLPGPGFHRLDFSAFKDIQLNERFRLQFRAEIFNIFNHPNFSAPNFGGNGVVSVSGSGNYNTSNFGEIGSTRDDPNDSRQIQFALKLYY